MHRMQDFRRCERKSDTRKKRAALFLTMPLREFQDGQTRDNSGACRVPATCGWHISCSRKLMTFLRETFMSKKILWIVAGLFLLLAFLFGQLMPTQTATDEGASMNQSTARVPQQ
jgi:hypothetical protein